MKREDTHHSSDRGASQQCGDRAGGIRQRQRYHQDDRVARQRLVPGASGKAVYKVKGSERELQIEVEHMQVRWPVST